MSRILVIEDNAGIARTLITNLEIEGHVADVALNGALGIERARDWQPDLVILDIMLPDINGFQVLRELRAARVDAPVLILSALGSELEKVRGFRLGADDYVTKPFGLMELLARVDALLRRARPADGGDARAVTSYSFGDVVVRLETRDVTRGGENVVLRPREFDLLAALLRHAGRIVPKKQLLREVWGYHPSVLTRTIDTHLAELRRKLEDDPGNPRHIKTLRGAGCRIDL